MGWYFSLEKLQYNTEMRRFFFHLYRISPSATQGDLNISAMPCIEFKFSNNIESILSSNLSIGTKFSSIVESEASSTLNSLVSTNSPLQTTLVSNSSIKHVFKNIIIVCIVLLIIKKIMHARLCSIQILLNLFLLKAKQKKNIEENNKLDELMLSETRDSI